MLKVATSESATEKDRRRFSQVVATIFNFAPQGRTDVSTSPRLYFARFLRPEP
jgi:hypothetical protein